MSFRLIIVGITFLGVVTVTGFAVARSPVQAANFTVNSTVDAVDAFPGDGLCDDGNGNRTLRAAIVTQNVGQVGAAPVG